MKFLSRISQRLGVAEHTSVVGGAVRDWILKKPIKDIDMVFDSIGAGRGRDSDWLARKIARAIPTQTDITTNNYGVAILTVKGPWTLNGHDLQGEVLAIANARKECYGGAGGKGYKPDKVEPVTIEEDVERREFTFNTLLWRLLDLAHGPDRAEILDLTGKGRQDLADGILNTPVNPDKTFSDDPTRMLRAIKFITRYDFKVPPDVAASIRRHSYKLKHIPWAGVRKLVVDQMLNGPNPRKSIQVMKKLGLDEVLKEMLAENPGFATAVGRELSNRELPLILSLLDLGWAFETPLTKDLDRGSQKRLYEVLLAHADDPAFEKHFMAAFKKPSIDQMRLVTEFDVPKNQRKEVGNMARALLREDPALAENPRALNAELEKALDRRFKQASSTERVVSRYLNRS